LENDKKKFPSSFGVCLISDGGPLREKGTLEEVLTGLVRQFDSIIGVQIRERVIGSEYSHASTEYIKKLTQSLKTHSCRNDFVVIINSDPELAKDVGADGVHLGKRSMSPKDSRVYLGRDAIIGYSAHSLIEIHSGLTELLDYCSLSPVFRPGSKKEYAGEILGTRLLEDACLKSNIPIFALGGISLVNLEEIKKTGASGVSIISEILHASNPMEIMSKFDSKLKNL
jgi:thiamine-phosphate pyrophosphorylase